MCVIAEKMGLSFWARCGHADPPKFEGAQKVRCRKAGKFSRPLVSWRCPEHGDYVVWPDGTKEEWGKR